MASPAKEGTVMRRVLTFAIACSTAAAVATAGAAVAQPSGSAKKVMKGDYDVTLAPDPTMEATGAAGMECKNIDPASADNHVLALPAKGMLKVDLVSDDPTGKTDWDLWLLDAKGNTITGSNGPSATEQINIRAGKGKVTIRACNLAGQPMASINYAFTYKK
jgi:hypothetical protein